LTAFAYLWQRNQRELLAEMIECKLKAIIIKVAALGTLFSFFVGKKLHYF